MVTNVLGLKDTSIFYPDIAHYFLPGFVDSLFLPEGDPTIYATQWPEQFAIQPNVSTPYIISIRDTCGAISADSFYVNVDIRGGELPIIESNGELTGEAYKDYGPAEWWMGTGGFSSPKSIRIPESMPLTEGNAGNHALFIIYGLEGSVDTLYYVGGANSPSPTIPSDIADGLFYHYSSFGDKYL